VFLPAGLSSSRLQPDIVALAAQVGEASSGEVLADLPGVGRMEDARAWHVPRTRNELFQVDGDSGTLLAERVFLFYRSPDAAEHAHL
jgi:hypothetical protein